MEPGEEEVRGAGGGRDRRIDEEGIKTGFGQQYFLQSSPKFTALILHIDYAFSL